MHVVIFDLNYRGHHYEYVGLLIPAIQSLGAKLTVALSKEGIASEEFRIHLEPQRDKFELAEASNIIHLSPFQRGLTRARELRRIISATKPDYLLVPSADGISQVLGVRKSLGLACLGNIESAALHFRGAYGYRLDEPLRRMKGAVDARLVTRAPWSVYYHLDPWQLESLKSRFPKFATKAALLPDPVPEPVTTNKAAARTELQLPVDARIIGCAGPMNFRKGVHHVLPAFDQAHLPDDALLLLAGRFDDATRNLVQSEYNHLIDAKRLIIIDRYMSQREMDLIIPAMDVVTTPYHDHIGSSGIILRGASCGRPILAADRHWMSRVVPTFDLGEVCNVRDHGEFAEAITRTMESASNFVSSKVAKRYVAFQSRQNFIATLSRGIREKLGLPQDKNFISWDSVRNLADSRSVGSNP